MGNKKIPDIFDQQLVCNQWREMDGDIFDLKKITSRSREKDNKNIVDILVGQAYNADLTVVPIVGMGGLGKTTLAQLVYNDPKIQKHFDVLLWVCVSHSFDVDSLAKSIVDAAPEKKDDATEAAASKKKNDSSEAAASKKKNDGIEVGQVAASKKKKTPLDILQNVVSGQRYLLVLDDVWTRQVHKWEKLKARLEHGGMGSAVLTTTRDKGVAEIMGTIEAYSLGALEGQYIKEIIETAAFSRFKEEERPAALVNMVDEIVDRCAGSPLAATALGSVLRTKTSEEEWKAVSSRSSICTVETGILPILKLSYNDLPSHMKQCFAFCAIFPKDYDIDVDKLIQLWIAHGFIIEEKQVRLETIGKHIFNELVSRSFFQDVKLVQATDREIEDTGSCYSRTTCKIHDLMHDVALSVMEKECALATEEPGKIEYVVTTEEPGQSEWLPNTARHLYLSCKEPEKRLNSSLEKISPAIQTLLCDGYMKNSLQHLSKYGSLQALQLCLYLSFPLKPKHLHHLRYLDLSRSLIKKLPEDMSILYNLQMLNLSGCIYLVGLPRQLKYMTALRHLYTHGCPGLKSMPRDLGKLTFLQTLTCFVVGSGSNCSNVGGLRNLNLGGQLELRNLENVKEEHATLAKLVNKKELRELTLRWSAGGNDATIHLVGCKKLQWLFNRGSDTSLVFPNLKELMLEHLECLERWWKIDNDGMQGEEIMFPRLEKLFISWCLKLTALPGQPTFPNLQNVFIQKCPELTTTAKSPKLRVLSMRGRAEELFLWVARHMTSLTTLRLHSLQDSTENTSAMAEHGLREVVESKENWNSRDFPLAVLVLRNFKSAPAGPSTPSETSQLLPRLDSLLIYSCKSLVEVFNLPTSLRKMGIQLCDKLEVLYLPPSLEELQIIRCVGLTSLESRSGQLPSLGYLWLSDCNTLPFLPDGPQAYSSLQYLYITNCPGMKMLPASLQQRLGSIQEEYIDAHYYGNTPRPMLLKPNTWKYAIRRD
nr:NBS-LRR disease resistance protein [Dasypyrum villosum]